MSSPISGFTAVPNPQMLAFMAAQSFIMMMQAGEGWQFGKRKQSAMTNEEFNKQTSLSIMQRQMSELKAAIPTIEQSMNAMTPMVRTIVIQYGHFMAEIVKALPEVLSAAAGGQTLTGNISTVGQEFAAILKGLIPNAPSAYADDNSGTGATDSTTYGPSGSGAITPPDLPNTSALKNQWINKIKNYSWNSLLSINSFTTVTAQQKIWTIEFMNSPAGQLKAPKVISTSNASQDMSFLKYQGEVDHWLKRYTEAHRALLSSASSRMQTATKNAYRKQLSEASSWIYKYSKYYRDPSANIRRTALLLKKELSQGKWKSSV